MGNFGQDFRHFRRQCSDPLRGGLLTQERMGELIGLSLDDSGYSGAAISDWERGKSKIHQDDRAVLLAIISVFHQNGGLGSLEEANTFLQSANYRALNLDESRRIFGDSSEFPQVGIEQSRSPVADVGGKQRISSRRRKQLILLEKVRSFWIEGVLAASIRPTLMLPIEMVNRRELVEHPWSEHFRYMEQQEEALYSDRILDVYGRADRALLILGEPGSGKTITLIALAAGLTSQAEGSQTAPIPVILDLSSWSKQRQSIAEWVVEELTAKYQIPRRYGSEWLADDELVLLLDGFDQLPAIDRVPAVNAINRFRETHGLTGIVLCSRKEEYRLTAGRLRFSGAYELLPLDSGQVNAYLDAVERQRRGLSSAVASSPTLQTMAQSPLFLGIMSSLYESSEDSDFQSLQMSAANVQWDLSAEETDMPYRQLFSAYVRRMIQRHRADRSFAEATTGRLLPWLALQMDGHNQTVFLIEQMQPSWLKNRQWRVTYMMISGLILGTAGGFIMWLLWQLLRHTLPQLPAFASSKLADLLGIAQVPAEAITILLGNVILGLIVAAFLTLLFERRYNNRRTPGSRSRQRWVQVIAAGLLTGTLTLALLTLTSGLLFGLAWCVAEAFMYMAAARFIFGWSYQQEIRPVEAIGWSWRHALNGMLVGLVLAIVAELIESAIYGYNGFARTLMTLTLAGFILGGLRGRQIRTKSRPNQGIWLSLRNAAWAAVIVALPLAALAWLLRDGLYALTIGLLAAIIAASLFGVSVFIKHFLLRVMLHHTAGLPWRFVEFLDYAAQLTLLRKVGGGYIFMHRLLQEYFASFERDE